MKYCIKKIFYVLLIFLIVVSLSYAFRTSILGAIGDKLIYENKLEKADVIIILGGDSYDRGNEAAKLYKQGYADRIVCLGGNIPTVFKALGISYFEAEVTGINLKNNKIPAKAIELIKESTSTKEDGEIAVKYAIRNNFKKVIIVSSKFHTYRINKVFQPLFEENGIALIIKGCPSSIYSIEKWWESEQGMITVNNEWMKHLYYFIKY